MKNENLIYITGVIILITGLVMMILNIPYSQAVFMLGITGPVLFQTWHVSVLKKRIKELENK